MRQRLALFDFDGTLTSADTLFRFTRSLTSASRFFAGLAVLSPPLVLQKAGLLSAQRAKELFMTHFFGGMNADEFTHRCQDFVREVLPPLLRPGGLAAITDHKLKGDRIIIVSASPQNWIRPWADAIGADVLATELELAGGKITGRIEGINCNGEEKVRRIREHVRLADYPEIIAYGDTKGDLPMLSLAGERHFKPFRQ